MTGRILTAWFSERIEFDRESYPYNHFVFTSEWNADWEFEINFMPRTSLGWETIVQSALEMELKSYVPFLACRWSD